MTATTRNRLLLALACSAAGLVLAGATVAVRSLWEGTPYPAADPGRVAARLKAHAQQVHTEAALPQGPAAPARVLTGTCAYRGLKALAHIDRDRTDVHSFHLDWRVTDVPEAVARRAQEPTRRRLERDGWEVELRDDSRVGFGFRFRHPGTGEAVDVHWYRPTGTYAVSAYAPCGKVPDGFDAHTWPAARWTPA
ncbi:hypothetical protein [Streptomyces sp. enrichment culture]|uniref:hypothetical protein n=1 Tax=Streptomyces sp. enrichment culture TaxID=1795815 RepID=UPI003F54E9B8